MHFSAEVAPGTGTGARLGLAVSRKVSTRAVQRNRIKRVARDSFRRHRALLDTCDIVLIARPVAAAADNAVLHAELARLWLSIAALNATGRAGTMRA
jgi:ribonuclease P protein component